MDALDTLNCSSYVTFFEQTQLASLQARLSLLSRLEINLGCYFRAYYCKTVS